MESMNVSSASSSPLSSWGGSPQDMERDCRSRLEVGAGNLSYALAVLNKHPEITTLAKSMVVTEYKREAELAPEARERANELRRRGVTVLFGVDATALEKSFRKRTFRRIQFNCPNDGRDYKKGGTRALVEGFFQSARSIQKVGDEIHLTLAQPRGKEEFYQVCAYGTVPASFYSGYQWVNQRHFTPSRYPGYEHTMTTSNQPVKNAEQSVEFIFKKSLGVDLDTLSSIRKPPITLGKRKCCEKFGVNADDPVAVAHFGGAISDGSSNYYVTTTTTSSELERSDSDSDIDFPPRAIYFYVDQRELMVRTIKEMRAFPTGKKLSTTDGKRGAFIMSNGSENSFAYIPERSLMVFGKEQARLYIPYSEYLGKEDVGSSDVEELHRSYKKSKVDEGSMRVVDHGKHGLEVEFLDDEEGES